MFRNNKIILRLSVILLTIFYGVGIIGILNPAYSQQFASLTPYTLLVSAVLLFLFSDEKWNGRTVLLFGLIYLSGYLLEVMAVRTGFIFGSYTYGSNLGPKLMETPLIIGVNWLILSYMSASIIQVVKGSYYIRIISAAILMVVMDIFIEQVAPKLDFWSWQGDVVPIKNYFAWFAASLFLQAILQTFGLNLKNKLAIWLMSIMFLFFILLTLLLK